MQIILEKREREEAAKWILTNILKNSPILYLPI
jgi:tartrate dehydratase alpha subunit/fumarate hydratase class I-like protein